MKLRVFLALVLGGMIGGAAVAAPARPAPAGGTAAEAPPPIAGTVVAREAGGFFAIEIVDGRFVISFYDEQRRPIAADVVRAALRWPVKYQPNDERAVLRPDAEGQTLTSERVVRPPYQFKLFVTLVPREGAEEKEESYAVDFRG